MDRIIKDMYHSKIQGLPSVRKEELAAVWVPCGLTNAGDNFDTFSIVESPLIPFSVTGINKRREKRED